MYDIIDFVMKNSAEISDYEIAYYSCSDENLLGEIKFTMKNGYTEIFQIC